MQESIAGGSAAAKRSRELLSQVKTKVETQVLRLIRLKQRADTLARLEAEFTQFSSICYSVSLSIKQATKKGELYHALQLCKEAAAKLAHIDYKRYDVLKTVAANVEKKTAKVLQKVKARLALLCRNFDATAYENVLLASASAQDASQLALNIHSEFLTAVSSAFKQGVEQWLSAEVGRLQLQSAVHLLPVQMYPRAMQDIFKALVQFMYSNHLFSRWHFENEYVSFSLAASKGCPVTLSYVSDTDSLTRLAASYAFIQDDLLRNRKYLWEKMQQKAAHLLDQGEQWLSLQAEDISRMLVWIDAFLQIGEDFSGAFSTELRDAVKIKVSQYFDRMQSQQWSSLL
jgi:hypothetical protein